MTNCRMLIAAVATLLCDGGSLLAAAPGVISSETRTYEVVVDRAKSGQSTLTITRYSDGSEVVNTDAKVTVTWAVFTYVYEFHGQERWQRGRLEQLSSRAIDGGRRLSLSATRTERGFTIVKSSGPQEASPDIQLTTNYWRQPSTMAAGSLNILDADNGTLYEARTELVGQQELTIAGRRATCNGLRLKGGVDVELWFDSAGYLVRQVGMEDGHHLELRLVAVQQPTAALADSSR